MLAQGSKPDPRNVRAVRQADAAAQEDAAEVE
jgi:hypothetical protein